MDAQAWMNRVDKKLDEIGDMPIEAQTRLLRVLQEGEYTTVGGRTPISTNVRIIAATHRDLRTAVRQGLFREDLFFDLSVGVLKVPPLRDRLEDIGQLASHFCEQFNQEFDTQRQVSADAVGYLQSYHWPGNVRELRNQAERAILLGPELAFAQSTSSTPTSDISPATSVSSATSTFRAFQFDGKRSRAAASTSLTQTSAPPSANACAMARPMPAAPPVMRTFTAVALRHDQSPPGVATPNDRWRFR